MKRNIFNIISILVVVLVLFSCKKFEPEEIYYDSVLLDLSNTKMTVLDKTLTTTIDFVSKTKNVSSADLIVGGNKIKTASVSGNKVTVTLNRSELGLKKIGDKVKLNINATVDGKVKEMWTVLKMVGSASMEEYTIKSKLKKNDAGKYEEDPSEVYQLSDVVKKLMYGIKTSSKDVKFTISQKVGKGGTFSDLIADKVYEPKKDTALNIKGSGYALGDTIFYRLVAKVDSWSDTAYSQVVIMPYNLNSKKSVSAKVDVEKSGFDLISAASCPVSSDTCNIQLTQDNVNFTQGFNTLNSASVVRVTDASLLKCNNLPQIKAHYDAGSPVTSVTDIKEGYVYFVKVVRDSKEYYGRMNITTLCSNNNQPGDDFFEFSYNIVKYDIQQ